MIEQADRVAAAARALAIHGRAVQAGEPWPLSAAYGAEPEADWGPKEVLAHVAEMIPYWMGEIDKVVAGNGDEPVPFGRIVTDDARIERIGRDRHLAAAELVARIETSALEAATRLRGIDPAAMSRLGQHVRLGDMTTDAIVERFIVAHLVDHEAQLRSILDARETATDGRPPTS